MRQLLTITILAIPFIFSSCSQKIYYQLYEVEAENTSKDQKDAFSFQKDSLTVTYNFWGKNGNLAFVVKNHSSSYAYIKLRESYFTVNGWTHNYYDQATYSISKSTSKEVNEAASFTDMLNLNQRNTFIFGNKSSKKVKTSFEEKERIGIPPGSKKQFLKFNLKSSRYTNCDLNLYPNQSDTAKFGKNITPLRFQNIIRYTFNASQKPSGFIENKFWTKEIININGSDFSYTDSREVCENKLVSDEVTILPYSAANRFYLRYKVGNSGSLGTALGLGFVGGVLLILGILS